MKKKSACEEVLEILKARKKFWGFWRKLIFRYMLLVVILYFIRAAYLGIHYLFCIQGHIDPIELASTLQAMEGKANISLIFFWIGFVTGFLVLIPATAEDCGY